MVEDEVIGKPHTPSPQKDPHRDKCASGGAAHRACSHPWPVLDSLCLRPPEPSLWKCFYFNSSCLGHLKTENREASLCRPRCLLCGEIHIVTRYNLEMRAFPYKVMITVQRCGSKQLTQAVDAFCLRVKGAYQEPIVTFLFLSD